MGMDHVGLRCPYWNSIICAARDKKRVLRETLVVITLFLAIAIGGGIWAFSVLLEPGGLERFFARVIITALLMIFLPVVVGIIFSRRHFDLYQWTYGLKEPKHTDD